MKLVLILTSIFALTIQASVFSQARKISIEANGETIRQVMQEIETKSDYRFFYNDQLANLEERVDFVADNITEFEAIERLFEGQDLTFQLMENNLVLIMPTSLARQTNVTGVVTDESGMILIGVTVVEKGTTNGVITDLNGRYRITVAPDAVLVFSSIGMETMEETVNGRTAIDITMTASFFALDEVVVTSLGIKKEKRKVGYSVQSVTTEELSVAREANVVNSLAGKVAGLDLTRTGGGVGSAARVVLRGNRSIAGNNQPLYIVDGVPISGSTNGGNGSESGSAWQPVDGISNINPDDIESVTVLKGANATALYGSRAQNGAIVITTKKGRATGLGIEFSTNISMETPMILTKFQNEYGQGIEGTYVETGEQSWGPKMTGQMVDHWSPDPNWEGPAQHAFSPQPNNVKDFFSTGINLANTIAVNTGNEQTQAYISYTNTQSQGILENNKLRRNNFNVRLTSDLSKKLTVDAKLSYINQEIDNSVMNGDNSYNPVRALYRQARNISLEDAQNYEYLDAEGNLLQHYWYPYSIEGQNVHWIVNNTSRFDQRDRILALASLRYEITEGLSLMIRSSLDKINDGYNVKAFNDTYIEGEGGNYRVGYDNVMEMNNDFILNYNHQWNDTWSVDLSLGGNMRNNSWDGLRSEIGGRYGNFITANLFSLQNATTKMTWDKGGTKKMNSLYAFANIGFKDYLYLDLTYRNDWSSTLPPEAWSYSYPSAGLTWIISDMANSLPDWLTFAKARASYAIVGNDTGWAQLNQVYGVQGGGDAGFAYRSGALPPHGLKPEKTNSLEMGGDVRLFKNRVGLDFTWYKTNTFEQLIRIPLPVTSGWSSTLVNAGNIENRGVEIILNATPVIAGDFRWDLSINFAHNENTVIEITDEIQEYRLSGGWMNDIFVVEGEPYGEIYTQGFQRDDNDNVLIQEANGLPYITAGKTLPMGNYNPDWMGGFSNQLRFKNINLGILMDMRMGGSMTSFTNAMLSGDGLTERTLEGRDGMVLEGVIPTYDEEGNIVSTRTNDVQTTSQAYWGLLGGHYSTTGEPFVYDASYVRLREIVFGYTFNLQSTSIQGLRLSLYGRNLGFLYNASEVLDPLVNVGTGNSTGGIEAFALPSTRQYGVNLKVTF
ncbi:MAG: SusC/RagA family TonB-linked outer membrane protein [Bacteroidota bacterium]